MKYEPLTVEQHEATALLLQQLDDRTAVLLQAATGAAPMSTIVAIAKVDEDIEWLRQAFAEEWLRLVSYNLSRPNPYYPAKPCAS